MEYCDHSYRLGRRAVQGPRPSSGNQGRDGKLATGRTSTLQLRKNLRLATWNNIVDWKSHIVDDNEHGRNAPEYRRQNRMATVSA